MTCGGGAVCCQRSVTGVMISADGGFAFSRGTNSGSWQRRRSPDRRGRRRHHYERAAVEDSAGRCRVAEKLGGWHAAVFWVASVLIADGADSHVVYK